MALQKDLYNQVRRYTRFRIDYNNINLLALSQIYVFELSLKRLEGKGSLTKIKKYSLDNYVKSIVSLFYRNDKKNWKSRYLFVNDVFNNSMVENIRAVQSEFDVDFIELISDKRLRKEKSKLLFKYFKPGTFLRQIIKTYTLIKQNSETIKEVCKEFEIKEHLLIFNIIDSMFILNCAESFLNAHRDITEIVSNTDVHKVSKAMVLLASKREINTYVIQHGSTVLEYGYLPVVCDYMFTWGKLSNNWFLDRGTKKEKLVTVGTPKMDALVNYTKQHSILRKVKNILLIMNPIGDKSVREFLKIVKGANLEMEYNLQIKLHPGSVDNIDIVHEIFDELGVQIYKRENTHRLIYDSDVVITTTSTVGNEAIAFNKALIQIKIENSATPMDYEAFDCSHLVENSGELKDLIEHLDKLESKKVNYKQFISDYFYALDGMSANRIKKFITQENTT